MRFGMLAEDLVGKPNVLVQFLPRYTKIWVFGTFYIQFAASLCSFNLLLLILFKIVRFWMQIPTDVQVASRGSSEKAYASLTDGQNCDEYDLSIGDA